MRLLHFLNEDINQLISFIERDCKYYLSLLKNKTPFYRGMIVNNDYGKKQVRDDRKPRGMKQEVANNLNDWLKKNGHTTRNNSVISTSNIYDAINFGNGNVYFIYPIGRFNYSYVRSTDINNNDNSGYKKYYIEEYKKLKDFIITNHNINEAYNKKYEIWFDCKEYYYIDAEKYKDIGKQI